MAAESNTHSVEQANISQLLLAVCSTVTSGYISTRDTAKDTETYEGALLMLHWHPKCRSESDHSHPLI